MPDQGTAFSTSPGPAVQPRSATSVTANGGGSGPPPFASLLFNPFGHGSIVIVQGEVPGVRPDTFLQFSVLVFGSVVDGQARHFTVAGACHIGIGASEGDQPRDTCAGGDRVGRVARGQRPVRRGRGVRQRLLVQLPTDRGARGGTAVVARVELGGQRPVQRRSVGRRDGCGVVGQPVLGRGGRRRIGDGEALT